MGPTGWSRSHYGGFKKILAIIQILVFAFESIKCEDFCTAGTGSAPVDLSDYMGISFTADLYAVDITANSASLIHEHYSTVSKRSAVYITSGGVSREVFYIYDFNKKKGLSNKDSNVCKEVSDESTIGLISFDPAKAKYVEKRTIDHEPLHLWRICTNSGSTDISLELFTTVKSSEWANPQGKDYLPVMLWRREKDSAGNIKKINYSVLRYQNSDNEVELTLDLEPPLGVSCPWSVEKSLPELPDSIIYHMEPSSDPSHPVTFIVDSEKRIAVRDISGPGVLDSKREIDSFDLQVSYKIDYYRSDSCGVIGYKNPSEDSLLESDPSYFNLMYHNTFETVDEFVGKSNEGFTYHGVYTVRGIPCDTYSKNYDDYKGAGPVTIILYFSTSDVDISSNLGDPSTLMGKTVLKYLDDGTMKSSMEHIFGASSLDYKLLTYDPLDMSKCYGSRSSIEFGVTLETDSDLTLTRSLEWQLKDAGRTGLASAASVDESRIIVNEISISKDSIFVLGKLLELRGFGKKSFKGSLPSSVAIPDSEVVESLTKKSWNGMDCMQAADPREGFVFGKWCENSKQCTMYKKSYETQLDSEKTGDCDYFGYSYPEGELSLHAAWDALSIEVGKGINIKDFKVTNIVRFDQPSENSTDPAVLRYEKTPGKFSSVVETLENRELSECAEACTESLLYKCEMFSYCDNIGLCLLNSPTSYSGRSEAVEGCNVYTRKYISEFTPFPAQGSTINTDYIFEEVDDPNICAQLCLENTDFRCESFQICTMPGGGSGACSLGKQHYFDISKASLQLNETCQYYSRDYLGDYNRKDGDTDLAKAVILEGSSPESCAKTCSEESLTGEAHCTMFQFCQTDNICELIDPAAVTSDAVRRSPDLNRNADCAVYSLKDEVDQVQGRSAASSGAAALGQSSNQKKTGYGPGAMAAVALIMLVLGVGLVFLVMKLKPSIASKLTKKRGEIDDMGIQFSKSQIGE